jgi:anti-sigma B factor antagonist
VAHGAFTVDVDRAATEAVVTVVGEIDVSTVGRLRDAVDRILTDAPPRIVLDLAGVTFCDSQGLGTLVALSQKARMTQSVLVLTNVGDFLLRVLDITGLRAALLIS